MGAYFKFGNQDLSDYGGVGTDGQSLSFYRSGKWQKTGFFNIKNTPTDQNNFIIWRDTTGGSLTYPIIIPNAVESGENIQYENGIVVLQTGQRTAISGRTETSVFTSLNLTKTDTIPTPTRNFSATLNILSEGPQPHGMGLGRIEVHYWVNSNNDLVIENVVFYAFNNQLNAIVPIDLVVRIRRIYGFFS